MSSLRRRFLHLLLMVAALGHQLPAQVGNVSSSDARGTGGGSERQPEASSGDPGSGEGAPPAADLVATQSMVFIIPGVINFGGLSGAGVLFGAGASEGYGWVHNGTPSDAQGHISVVQPYVGLFQAGHRHRFLFEYSPTVDLFNKDHWDGSVLQRGGIRASDRLSERWGWNFSSYTTYGQEYLRQLGGLATGEFPGWLTFSVPTDKLFVAAVSTGLTLRSKPLQEFSFTVGDTYSSVRHGPHFDDGSARVQMTNYFGRESKWYTYAQANRYTNQPGCTRIGAGGGFVWNASVGTTISAEAGPEYGSGTCVDRWTSTFGASLSQHLTPTTVLYLSATRDLVEPYLLQSRWTDIYSAKLWQKTSQNTYVAAGAAYARSSVLPGETMSRYRGLLYFSEFHWRMSNSLTLVGSYRYFKRDLSDPSFEDRNSWVFLSIVWHPFTRGMRRAF